MTDTGKIIKACRESLHWSRMKLSREADVPINTIVSCEQKPDCKVSTFERIIEAMGFEMEVMRKE